MTVDAVDQQRKLISKPSGIVRAERAGAGASRACWRQLMSAPRAIYLDASHFVCEQQEAYATAVPDWKGRYVAP